MVRPGRVDPIPVARASGVYFWTPEGTFLDFNSQLMCVNVGHGDNRVIEAIQSRRRPSLREPVHGDGTAREAGRQAGRDCARRHRRLLLHQRRRGGERERDQAGAAFTGRHKILARYRSYHGGTSGAMALTGDPRRWEKEPGIPGVVHVLDPYTASRAAGTTPRRTGDARGGHPARRAGPIAAFFLETVTGTNGVLIPPDGYLQGVRELCTTTAS